MRRVLKQGGEPLEGAEDSCVRDLWGLEVSKGGRAGFERWRLQSLEIWGIRALWRLKVQGAGLDPRDPEFKIKSLEIRTIRMGGFKNSVSGKVFEDGEASRH